MYDIDRIAAMEELMNVQKTELEAMRRALERFSSGYGDFLRLYRYYGSPEYNEDRDAMEGDLLPEGLRCGVLTEDLLDELVGDEHGLLVQMLDLVNRMVKK